MKTLSALLLAGGAVVFASSHQNLAYDWSHSLYAPYISVEGKNNNWDFDALVSMHDFVQLTPEMPDKVGWAFTKEVFEAENWTVDFFFRITGTNPHSLADGMAFWFTEERFVPGDAFGYKNNFKGLGVFFDVFQNKAAHHAYPWISAMVGDGMKVYDHHSDGHEHQLAGCHQKIVNTQHPVQARLKFDKNTLELALKIEDNDWKVCFIATDVKLPKRGYIGFTAKTGGLSARHELLAVTTARIEHPATAESSGGINMHHRSASSTHSVLFFLVFFAGCLGFGFYLYKNNQKKHHF